MQRIRTRRCAQRSPAGIRTAGAWLLIDQAIAPIQIAASLLVGGAVMALGLRRR
jgi:hypothetical protein